MQKIKIVLGTHPIPKKYLDMHLKLGTWNDLKWQPMLAPSMATEEIRKAYNQYR
jgi:hypothetical protein